MIKKLLFGLFAIIIFAGIIIFKMNIGTEFEKGILAYEKKDFNKALKIFEKLVLENNVDALYNLGVMHENAKGVKQDYNKTKKYYELAVNAGYVFINYFIGELYFIRQIKDENYEEKAQEYYIKTKDYLEANEKAPLLTIL